MPSGLEIQKALRALANRWRGYSGTERGEAQTFLNQLFECYGTERFGSGARFEDAHASVGIMDLYWPGTCIVEMKDGCGGLSGWASRTTASTGSAGLRTILRPGSARDWSAPTPSRRIGRARRRSTTWSARGGLITDAVSSQKWPGEAKVHVALVNWVKDPAEPPTAFTLDGLAVPGITASLTIAGESMVEPLAANKGRCFQGPIPVGDGFVITEETASWLLAQSDASYVDVVRPYLVSENLAERPDQGPGRWVIDFAARSLEESMKYPAALDIVRTLVRPVRESNNREGYRRYWWRFGEHRPGMRAGLDGMSRYIAAGRLGKRLNLAWQVAATCPSDLVYVFAFDDDYSMGILLSRAHGAWVRSGGRGSTFKADPRYTPTSGFMTFPWPDPVRSAERDAVAVRTVELLDRRSAICLERQIGLTTLYNDVDEGAHQDLRVLHQRLDEAVAGCYGWPKKAAQDDAELVRRLVARNASIARRGDRRGGPALPAVRHPVTAAEPAGGTGSGAQEVLRLAAAALPVLAAEPLYPGRRP